MSCVRLLMVIMTVALILLASYTFAEVPKMINYQGRLTNNTGNALDTIVSITFTIYDDSLSGTEWWTEIQDSVDVSNGLFNVQLGSVNPISDTLFSEDVRWLEISVGGELILPRTRLITVPYSYRVNFVDLADIAQNGALAGQVIKWDGSTWVAANDETGGTSADTSGTFLAFNRGPGFDLWSNIGNTREITSIVVCADDGQWAEIKIDNVTILHYAASAGQRCNTWYRQDGAGIIVSGSSTVSVVASEGQVSVTAIGFEY